jgi:hypothetical protein
MATASRDFDHPPGPTNFARRFDLHGGVGPVPRGGARLAGVAACAFSEAEGYPCSGRPESNAQPGACGRGHGPSPPGSRREARSARADRAAPGTPMRHVSRRLRNSRQSFSASPAPADRRCGRQRCTTSSARSPASLAAPLCGWPRLLARVRWVNRTVQSRSSGATSSVRRVGRFAVARA